ncbi:MAG: S-methyl-5-thioribose-1-phosphate isomerase [Cohaesibacter sp.]|nr:S-methyl-5-thioribose-1-phosphate isomerase [Cohaesibacter sp.]
MKVDGQSYRTIWFNKEKSCVEIIDQRLLPHQFVVEALQTAEECATAIRDMWVRGAPLIGAAAAYGLAMAMKDDDSDQNLKFAKDLLLKTRPTAVNLRWALEQMEGKLLQLPTKMRFAEACQMAEKICQDDIQQCFDLGRYGLKIIEDLSFKKGGAPVNILTHCNAGWLATVDWGTATSPIYQAHEKGIPIHVWVDETRPRNQGASLTAWELQQNGIDHTLIVDNAGGHLMQHGQVDMVLVGTDRTTASGDVCNKIGTYLKALAAYDNNVPFFVALPSPTIDWTIEDGVAKIPIEMRAEEEVSHMMGKGPSGGVAIVQITPDGVHCANPAFDVTPARLVTGLITERGVSSASKEGLLSLFPERRIS